MSDRTTTITQLHALTASNTMQDVFSVVMDYLADQGDPSLVVAINSTLGRVSASATVISVPAAVRSKVSVNGNTANVNQLYSTV